MSRGVPLGGGRRSNDGGCGKSGNTLGCMANGGRLTDDVDCGRRLCSAGVSATSPTVRCDSASTDLELKGNTGKTAQSSP